MWTSDIVSPLLRPTILLHIYYIFPPFRRQLPLTLNCFRCWIECLFLIAYCLRCLFTFLTNDTCLAKMKLDISHAMFSTREIRTTSLPCLFPPPLCRTASCVHTWLCLFPRLSWSACRPAGVFSRLQPSHLLLLSMYLGKIHGLLSVHTEQFQPET